MSFLFGYAAGARPNQVRAQSVSVKVPLTAGTLGTLPAFGLVAPITYARTGGNSNLSLSGSTYAAAVALAAGASQSMTGTATGGDGCVVPWTLTCTGQAAAPTLAALALSANAATVGTAATINITGATAGSTITGTVPDGMTLNSAARTITGTPTTAGTYSFPLVETLAGATGSPKSSTVTITVAAASGDAFYLASSRTAFPGFDNAAQSDGVVTIQRQRIHHTNDSEQLMGRVSLHYTGAVVTVLSEADGPNAFQVRGAIEYPEGVFHRAYDASSNTLATVQPDGSVLVMTTADAVNIPPGAEFWERTETIVPVGQKWPNTWLVNTSLGEAVERDTDTATDKTMGGTITSAGTTAPAGLAYGASAIRATMPYAPPVRAFVFGNSIAANRGDAVIDGRGLSGWPSRLLSGRVPFTISAFSSSSLANNVAGGFTRRLALAQSIGITHAIIEWGVNDLRAPKTEAQIAASIATLKAQLDALNIKMVLCTSVMSATQVAALPPIVADQSPYNSGFAAGAGSERGKFNAKVRSLAYGHYAYFEAANPVETAQDSALWAGLWSGAAADMSGDLLHPSGAGHTAIVNANTAAVAALKGTPRVPGVITAPAISGTAQVGYTLTVSNGVWSFSPTGYAYQWYAAGAAISGATASTYTPVAGDVGKAITCQVTATNAGGSTATTTAATAAVQAAQSYQTETATLLAAMTVQPSTARATLIDNLIAGLKSDGVWSKLAVLEVFAAHDEQAAKLEWKTATQKVTIVNAPAYTVDRGYTLVPASSQYIKTGITASGLTTVSQNSLSHGLYLRAGTTTAVSFGGLVGATGRMKFSKSGSGALSASVNDAGATQLASPGTAAPIIAHHAIVRSGASATAYYVNGSLVASLTTASNGIESAEHVIGLDNATYSDPGAVAFWVADGTLTATEVAALHNRLATFKAAIGA